MARAYTEKALEYSETRTEFTMDPRDLFEMLQNNDDINVIDVREPFDFAKGHIPGALNLPRSAWSSNLSLTEGKLNVIYSYSAACHLAAKAAKYFAEHDFHVMELEGGFEEWKRHVLPVVK